MPFPDTTLTLQPWDSWILLQTLQSPSASSQRSSSPERTPGLHDGPIHMGACMHLCVWMCRPNNNLSVVLRSFPPFAWGRVSWRPGSVRAKAGGWLSPRDPPNVRIINTHHGPHFHLDAGDPGSGPRACKASPSSLSTVFFSLSLITHTLFCW